MYWDIRRRTYSCGGTVEDVNIAEIAPTTRRASPLAHSTDLKDVWRRRL